MKSKKSRDDWEDALVALEKFPLSALEVVREQIDAIAALPKGDKDVLFLARSLRSRLEQR